MGKPFALLTGLLMLFVGQTLAMPVGSGQLGDRLAGDPAKEVQCVPPGLPPFSTWTGGPASPFVVPDAEGRPRLGIQRAYTAQGQTIQTFWVGSILVTVDPAPADPTERGWHDRGALNPDTSIKDEPTQACQWFKPAPRRKDET